MEVFLFYKLDDMSLLMVLPFRIPPNIIIFFSPSNSMKSAEKFYNPLSYFWSYVGSNANGVREFVLRSRWRKVKKSMQIITL